MMGSMRSRAGKRAFKVFIWIFIFGMAASLGVGPCNRTKHLNKPHVVAEVDGQDIFVTEFEQRYKPQVERIRMIKQKLGDQAEMLLRALGISDKPEESVVDGLIQDKLFENFVDTMKISLTPTFVEEKLKDSAFVQKYLLGKVIPQEAFENGTLNVPLFALACQQQGIAPAHFDEMLRKQFLLRLIGEFPQLSLYIPEEQIKQEFIKKYVRNEYELLWLDLKKYEQACAKTPATDQQLREYWRTHQDDYRIKEKRVGSAWSFSPAHYGITVTDKEIEGYYNNHKLQLVSAPEKIEYRKICLKGSDLSVLTRELEKVRLELQGNMPLFTKMAREKSAAPEKDALLTAVRGHTQSQLDKVAFYLAHDGDVSSVLQTESGVELIQRVGRKAPQYKPLDAVRGEIERTLRQARFVNLFTADARRVIGNQPSFEKLVQTKKAQASSLSGLSSDRNQALQKLFTLHQGARGFFINEQGNGCFVQLNKVEPSYVLPYETVKNKVIDSYNRTHAQEKLIQDLKKARLLLETQDMKKTAHDFDATYETINWVSLFDPQKEKRAVLAKIVAAKLPFERLERLTSVGQILDEYNATKDRGYLIRLTKQEAVDEVAYREKRREILADLYKERLEGGLLLMAAFLNTLKTNATIKINKEFLARYAR